MGIIIHSSGENYSFETFFEVFESIADGRISPLDYYWDTASSQWKLISNVEGFTEYFYHRNLPETGPDKFEKIVELKTEELDREKENKLINESGFTWLERAEKIWLTDGNSCITAYVYAVNSEGMILHIPQMKTVKINIEKNAKLILNYNKKVIVSKLHGKWENDIRFHRVRILEPGRKDNG